MVGCIPEITPDKTPPDVTAKTATLSATTIDQGDPLTVEVQVTAEDKRSNLKNAQITLLMQKPNENGFSEVDTATIAFPENVKTGSVTKSFVLAGTNFDIGGTYNFKAEIKVSDIRDNISQEPVEVSPAGSLNVTGQEEKAPVITEPSFSPRVNNAVPPAFSVTVGATDDDGDLVLFEFTLMDEEETILHIELTSVNGTTQLSATRNVTVDMEDLTEKTLRYFILARDKEGNTTSMDNQELIVRRTEIGFITHEFHVDVGKDINNAQTIGNYAVTADPSDIPTETPTVYELPFGITTLTFEVYPGQSIPTNMAKVFIYSEPEDIFNQDDQFKRGESNQIENLGSGHYKTSIEFANLSADNAKWLALYIQGATKPWYVWKISAADHATTPQVILQDFGTIEEFIEGKPVHIQLDLKDEMLLSLDDLRIEFLNNQETSYLEELIHNLNQHLPMDAQSRLGWPTDDSWRFAVRYHAKVTYVNYPDAYEDIRIRDLEPDPDPKTIYAISDPVYQYDGTPPSHTWQRFDAETGVRVNWDNDFVSNDMLYFFGVPDRQIQSLNRPEYITDIAHMSVHLYPEIVVVDQNNPDEVIYVSDAALGAGNRYILETATGYKQYNIMFTAENAKRDTGSSVKKIFPIYADNTSPEIKLTYGPDNFKKYFADRRPEDLQTNDAFDRIAPPMFFVDTISLKAGQTLSVEAKDNIALYDFTVLFTSDNTSQDSTNWRSNLPAILNPLRDNINIPLGYDFLYKSLDEFYTGQTYANKNKEDKPTQTLNQILLNEPNPISSKALYTDIYSSVQPGSFSIDGRYEVYENYTWSEVRNAKTTGIINVDKQEQYFTRMTDEVEKDINMPSVPGTYWVWIIARDRGAQDSWLFDYENNRVNIDPLTGNPEIYEQNVKFNQNNYFTVDPNLENVEIYYENSESEADAPMAILLRVIVESHSMDIQRLDIKEPCLVSYPNEWYAHSYNVLQLDGQTKVAEFDEGESRQMLPMDVYPVFKRQASDHDVGNKFGLSSNGAVLTDNLNGAVETNYYGDYVSFNDPSFESVPVVGGINSTTFRVKTHEDIEKVKIELVNKKVWTAREYAAQIDDVNILDHIVIEKNRATTVEDGEGMGGYWTWEIDLSSYPGFEEIETYGSIIVKAFNDKNAQFFEQWQWPIFVDTKGPEIDMYTLEKEGDPQMDFMIEDIEMDHLKVNRLVEPTSLVCCPSTVERWVGFQLVDRGGLMIEFEKGYKHSLLEDVKILRTDRRYDLCSDAEEDAEDCETFNGHKAFLRANDSYYDIFQNQNISDPSNSRLLGFPGDHPNVFSWDKPVSSLKYLTREVNEYEDLELTAPWHDYYLNMSWGSYDGSNWKKDPVEIPEIVFLNNIDLLNGLWEDNDDITKKFLEFSVRDELGNEGTWESYLRRKDIMTPDNPEISPVSSSCADTTLRATSDSASTGENIKSLMLKEKATGNIFNESLTGITVTKTIASPDTQVSALFKASDFMAPAWQTSRYVQLMAETLNESELSADLYVDALYTGQKAELSIEPLENFLDIKKYLAQSGKNNLNALVKEEERYVYAGFDNHNNPSEPVKVRVTANDDNVDKYEVYNYTMSTAGVLISEIELNAFGTEVFELQYDPSDAITYSADTALIQFLSLANDCPLDRFVNESLQIFYQNPDTFIVSVQASPSTPNSTQIEVELESDILWETKQDIINAFSFEVNGVLLEIDDVTGWDGPLTQPGRGSKFLFSVNPFMPSGARMITETFGNITVTIENIIGAGLGKINNLTTSGGKVLPKTVLPEENAAHVNKQVLFRWTAADNPGVYLNKYVLYIKSDDEGQYKQYDAGKNLEINLNLELGKTYTWFILAEFADGTVLQSETSTFGRDLRVEKLSGPDNGQITNNPDSTFTWQGHSQTTTIVAYEIRKNNGFWQNIGLTTIYNWAGYAPGNNTFTVRVKDDEDNYSEPVTWTFTYETVFDFDYEERINGINSFPTDTVQYHIDFTNIEPAGLIDELKLTGNGVTRTIPVVANAASINDYLVDFGADTCIVEGYSAGVKQGQRIINLTQPLEVNSLQQEAVTPLYTSYILDVQVNYNGITQITDFIPDIGIFLNFRNLADDVLGTVPVVFAPGENTTNVQFKMHLEDDTTTAGTLETNTAAELDINLQ